MNNSVEVKQTKNSLVEFSQDDVETIRNHLCPGIGDGDLKLFLKQCLRTGLDPFSKQIYAVLRDKKDKEGNVIGKTMAIQTAIDGFRLIAERTGKYEGQVGPFWCGPDGKWVDVWLKNIPPAGAKVGVIKENCKEPFWGIATWFSYAQTYNNQVQGLWKKMPEVMLAKCAEALALRKAFPNDLSGVYSDDEMSQAAVSAMDSDDSKTVETTSKRIELPRSENAPSQPTAITPAASTGLVSEAQLNRLYAIQSKSNWRIEDVKAFILEKWGHTSSKQLTKAQYDELIDKIQGSDPTPSFDPNFAEGT